MSSPSIAEPAIVEPAAIEPTAAESVAITQPPIEKPFPRWTGWDVVAIFVFTIVTVIFFTAAALLIAHTLPAYRNLSLTDLATTNVAVVIGGQAAAYPVVVLFIFFLVRTRSKERFGEALRWNWPGTLAPVFFVGGLVLAPIIEGLARYLPIPKTLPVDTFFHDASSAYLMAAFGMTLAPLLEELFFRGLLYPLLRRRLGLVIAVTVTAAAFAAIHGAQLGYAWGPVLSIFVVGVVLTLVRVRTDSVAASFLTHVGYNSALFGLLWVATDHFRHLEKLAG